MAQKAIFWVGMSDAALIDFADGWALPQPLALNGVEC